VRETKAVLRERLDTALTQLSELKLVAGEVVPDASLRTATKVEHRSRCVSLLRELSNARLNLERSERRLDRALSVIETLAEGRTI